MNDTDVDELGPVDYLVVEFPVHEAKFSGEMAAELTALIDRDLARVLDLLFLKKNATAASKGLSHAISTTVRSASSEGSRPIWRSYWQRSPPTRAAVSSPAVERCRAAAC